MSDARLTIRFTDEEIAGVETHAKVLDMSKTEVVRLAVQGLFSATRTMDKVERALGDIRADLKADVDHKLAQLSVQQKRATLLLLRVLKAPPEAEAVVDKIFGE